MKSTRIVNSIAIFLSMLICSSLWAKDKKENETQLLIETHKKIVKGFPVILKIKTAYLQRVPKMSLFDKLAYVSILFVSEKDGTKYTISSPRRGYDTVFTGPDGEATGHIPHQLYEIYIKPNEKRTKLLEITSLLSHGQGMIFDDIPPGKYIVSVKFSSTGKTSNEINVEIIEPSKAEKKYLKNILKSHIPSRKKDKVIWSQLLLYHLSVPEKGLSKLSIDAQNQLRFHLLLSKVLRLEKLNSKIEHVGELRESIRGIINSSKVQDFLRIEKECLKLQVFGSSDKKKAFTKRYPGLAWRLDKSQQEERGFFIFPLKK